MKERSLLYFTAALITSLIFILTIILYFSKWQEDYGYVLPSIHQLAIPLVLIWLAWFFRADGFALAAGVLVAVILGNQLIYLQVLNNQSIVYYVPRLYAPMVRTSYLMLTLLLIGSMGFSFFGYYLQTKKA